jgi:ABC-type antimicrobial peptide transport system permease subunit
VVEAGSDAVTSGFFETVGIARIAGRDFGPLDRPDVPLVAIINEALARQLAGGADQAIGLAFTINPTRPEPRVYHVIGVVADAHYYSVQGAPAPMFWASLIQEGPYMPTIHVRTPASDTAPVLAAVRRELDVLDSNFPVFNVRTLGARIDDALSQERLVADLAATFGGVALLLAMTGLYGVLAYSVAKRTREIGLRMALGSSPARVLWLVGREATQVVTVGGVAGLALGVAAARLFANSFSGVSAVDPVAFVIAAATMVIVAVVAGGLPALRAARVDPLVALRTE